MQFSPGVTVNVNQLFSDNNTLRNKDVVSNSGFAFGGTTAVGPNVGLVAFMSLFNPAASGKIFIIDQVIFSTPVAGRVTWGWTAVAATGTNKGLESLNEQGVMATTTIKTMVGSPADEDNQGGAEVVANENFSIEIPFPIIMVADTLWQVNTRAANRGLSVWVSGREYPV